MAARKLPGHTRDSLLWPPMTRPALAWPTALAGIVVFSFSAALYKLSGAPPAVGSTLRFAYGTIPLAILAWRAGALRPGPDFPAGAIAGVLVGIEVVLWNEATVRIGAGPSTVIVNTASLWVMGISAVFLHRPVARRSVGGVLVVLVGLVLLRGTGSHHLELAGILLAVVSAAIYGVYLLLFDIAVARARHRMAPVLWSTAIATPTSLVLALISGESFDLTRRQHAWLFLLGVGVQAGGWLIMARALRWFSAVTISILLLLQPALAAVWGVTFLNETLTAIQVAGIAVVLAGVAVARPTARE
jgi:drug/metabolite transporter (DMT)-like permease